MCFCQDKFDLGLLKYDSFFQQQRPALEQWVDVHLPKAGLKGISVKTDSSSAKVLLDYTCANAQACANARKAWQATEAAQPSIAQQILKHWAFLAEAQPHEVSLEVRCCTKEHFLKQYALPPAALPEGFTFKSGSVVPTVTALPFDQPTIPNNQNNSESPELSALIKYMKAPEVCKAVRKHCQTKYASLPKARYVWDAELKFIDLNANEFILEVSYITNVVAQDRYFEYHRIHVSANPVGLDTQLKVDFRAKYGSGILFAPRRNDYKDMENTLYKTDLMQYRQVFFAQVINLFSN
jgi:hypothetical protein